MIEKCALRRAVKASHALATTGALSRRANPSDNAKAERCIKALKVEAVYLRDYASFEDVATDLPGFIEEVYDTGGRFRRWPVLAGSGFAAASPGAI